MEFLKASIWTLGFGTLIGVTLKDFLPLVSEYNNNNVATQIEVITGERNFHAPQLVLEVQPIDYVSSIGHSGLIEIAKALYDGNETDCDLCKRLEENSWDVWNQMNLTEYKKHDFNVFYEALCLAFAQKLLTEFDSSTRNVFDPSFSSWNQPILAAVIKFLRWQNFIDYYLKFPRMYPPQLQPLFASKHEILLKNIDAVFSQVWEAVCQNMVISESTLSDDLLETSQENTTCENIIRKSSIPVTFSDGLMLPMPPFGPGIAKPRIFQVIFANTSFLETETGIYIYADASIQYTNALTSVVASFLSEILSNTPEQQSHSIWIKYSVQMRAVETRSKASCHNESSPSICIKKCVLNWLIGQCGCIPFSMKEGLGKNFLF